MEKKGVFKKGDPRAGRPKGVQNKFTVNLKDAFLEVFEGLGGAKGLLEWAKTQRNRSEFYKIIAKMLPANVIVDGDIGIGPSYESVRKAIATHESEMKKKKK